MSVLRQACRSLGEAHAAGVLHRDIKPHNLFLCRLGLEFDVVKVLDFGLVKSLHDDAAQLTTEGALTGTPAYMPPERVLGAAADERSDLYVTWLRCLLDADRADGVHGRADGRHDPSCSDASSAAVEGLAAVPFPSVSSRSSSPASRKRRRSARRRRSSCGASSARCRCHAVDLRARRKLVARASARPRPAVGWRRLQRRTDVRASPMTPEPAADSADSVSNQTCTTTSRPSSPGALPPGC